MNCSRRKGGTTERLSQEPIVRVSRLGRDFLQEEGLRLRLLRGVCFEGRQGECIEISGPNGTGKSTLLKILAGMEVPTCGRVEWLKPDPEIAFLAQALSEYCGRSLRVVEQLNLGRFINGSAPPGLFRCLVSQEARDRAFRLLGPLDLGLERRLDSFMGELSGGQQQAVMLATLIGEHPPDLLLLDEHSTALDALVQNSVARLVGQALEDGAAVFFVSHKSDEPLRRLRTRVVELPQVKYEEAVTEIQG